VVTGAIGVGTDGELEVINNTVLAAHHDGIWFYPLGPNAKLTIEGNTVASDGPREYADILLVGLPKMINGESVEGDDDPLVTIKGIIREANNVAWVEIEI